MGKHSTRQRLLARINRQFRTVTEVREVEGLPLVFTRIADPDAVLDAVVELEDQRERLSGKRIHSDHLHLPYWAELWDSALGLGQWIVRTARQGTEDGAGRVGLVPYSQWSVLDLGCGMGLAGT